MKKIIYLTVLIIVAFSGCKKLRTDYQKGKIKGDLDSDHIRVKRKEGTMRHYSQYSFDGINSNAILGTELKIDELRNDSFIRISIGKIKSRANSSVEYEDVYRDIVKGEYSFGPISNSGPDKIAWIVYVDKNGDSWESSRSVNLNSSYFEITNVLQPKKREATASNSPLFQVSGKFSCYLWRTEFDSIPFENVSFRIPIKYR